MKPVVIIGANGFLGRNLTFYYANQGCSVIALIPYGFPYDDLKGNSHVVCKEFDFASLDDLLLECDDTPSVIYHLAWAGVSSTV